MAPFLAACGQHLAAAFGLHANAKAVRLGAAAFARLICTLWQSNSPSVSKTFLRRCVRVFPNQPRAMYAKRIFVSACYFVDYHIIAGLGTKPSTDRFGSCSGIF
jgi:hypothetical protein